MNIIYLLSVVTGVIECLLFSGLLFGWASFRYVLQVEGYYDLCSNNDASDMLLSNGTMLTETLTTEKNPVNFTSGPVRPSYSTMTVTDSFSTTLPEADGICQPQSEKLNLVFTIASTILSFSTLPNGYIYDTFGTWVARAISVSLFTLGCILMAVSSADTSWLLFPSMGCLAVAGILMLLTNMQVGNLFGKFRSSIITAMSGALDSSSFVFLIFKFMHGFGIDLATIFGVFASCSVLLWLRTFLLLPKRHIPFPIPKGYNYGFADFKCQKRREPKEMSLVKADATDNGEEEQVLTTVTEVKQVESVWYYIKSSLFWGNAMHFSLLQLRNYFFMGSLYEWLKALAGDEVSSYLDVFGFCQLFGVFFAPLNGMLIDAASRILKKRGTDLDVVPLLAVTYSAIVTTALGTLFAVIIVVPSLPLQYVSFMLQVVFRSFLYGGNISFVASAFPGQHFGKLYGLTMFIGGAIALLQYPLFTFVLREMNGNFLVMNIIFVFVSLLTILHPLNVYWRCKMKSAASQSIVQNAS